MIHALTYLAKEKKQDYDWEGMGLPQPEEELEEAKEVDFWFHKEEIYTLMHLEDNIYFLTLNSGDQYAIKLTKTELKKIIE